ncbi:basement membrane-specific heparan sulfate proteoglycan core protein isoform X9 [Xenopus laevis]|uniref:Basement membrane-specific heparan sulfate proteoglycan core protein n=1 Tax=Xenopus laevis TaxID=8355 RepID=A0A8J1L8H2_XENLA|nr:basement membrane-specific heparan sulfate proteoglycan core protein isoform X9 [Xenopus laevis]
MIRRLRGPVAPGAPLLLFVSLLLVPPGVVSFRGLDEVNFPDAESDTRTGQNHWRYRDLGDDEDFAADEASGDDIGSTETGSGTEELSPATPPSLLTPTGIDTSLAEPQLAGMSVPEQEPFLIYYRALVNFTQSIDYTPDLDNVSSPEFTELSEAVVDTLESEYHKIPGEQMVSVVYVKIIDRDTFVELDVGSEGNSNDAEIRQVLFSVIDSGSIASYIISTQGFQFRRLGSVTPSVRPCRADEFTCTSGDCVPAEYRCDQRHDCRDMSDELGCESEPSVTGSEEPRTTTLGPRPGPVSTARPATTSASPVITTTAFKHVTPKPPPDFEARQCRRDEARCPNGHCIPRDYLCDGEKDCKDGSDEMQCGTPSPCEPNEFKCKNGRCALKLWRCDGDNDCGDGSDELNCPTKGPSDTCAPDQFVCVQARTCIPASYQCDDEADCPDRSDEVGCNPPQVITPPEESIMASRGETVRFTCVAIGVPTPIITWRLNWGHIPTSNRVSMTSENGHGTLIIRDVKEADQGAYTCEAINAKGMVFGIPDGVLVLKPHRGPCPEGSFYVESSSRCIPCFCFGVTKVCQQTGHYRNQIRLRFDVPEDFKGVNITVPSHVGIPPLSSNQLQIDTSVEEFQLVDLSRRFLSIDSFWTLPGQFLGNKVDSYGGSLSFKVRYGLTRGQSEPVRKPDVILIGNGRKLIYRVQTSTQPSIVNQRKVQFTEENWQHESGAPVTREDLLMTLQNLEGIMIQTVYDNKMASVGISDIVMDTTSVEYTQLGPAVGVEECRCPGGYAGLSCEVCAAQFERVPGGPFLGTCSGCNCNGHASSCDPVSGYCLNCQHNTEGPQCNKCKAGFFGDPTRGVPDACRPCPCPHTDPRRRFSDTCFMDVDGQPTCDSCAPGYTGRRCERCAEGYDGRPMQPGGRCEPVGNVCDVKGALSTSDGSCVCKAHVEGNFCSECKSGTFYLSEKNPDGCLKCFCMGVTRQCSSSFWNRDQVSSTYDSQDRALFTISNAGSTRTLSEGIRVTGPSELTFSNFLNVPQDVYFWVLPDRFKGDKVTSYGGELRYTITFEAPAGSQPLYNQPDVVLQGNGIFLEHLSNTRTAPGFPITITVPFRERAWRRADGQDATREHLLMALADIDLLMIRSSYAERMVETRISNIHMDVAVPFPTDRQRAVEVEQCVCPPGYNGPSCQDCDTGYTRSTSGLYLGTCERCQCGGHSSECDRETGECLNCQDNTEGTKCEKCKSGFYGDPTRGTTGDCQPCPCQGTSAQYFGTCFLDRDGLPTCDSCPVGYAGRQCERCAPGYRGDPARGQPCTADGSSSCPCDLRGSVSDKCDSRRQCECKPNVEGSSCGTCRPQYFHLSTENPEGCLPCFCMGVTQQCSSSTYHRELISTPFLPGNFQNFALINRQHSSRITSGFTVEMSTHGPQLTHGSFDQLGQESYYWQLPEGYQGDKFSLVYKGFSLLPEGVFYWQLPKAFLGDKVASYGGKLRYTLTYNAGVRGSALPDADVQITGNDITLVAYQPEIRPRESKTFEIVFRERFWKRPDGQPATREHLMMALADLDEILIRASYSTDMLSSSITGVSMETAGPSYTNLPQALEVEECRCPPGYQGLSCQDCAPGYTRTGGGLYLGHCEPCYCNGHSDSCHPETGACSNCLHNTVGESCDQCAPGFYGDASAGTPEDCQPCACPLTNPENQFSRTCEILGTSGYRCTACQPGYTGQYCERCASGYTGNPNIQGQKCVPEDSRSKLVVRIHPQKATVTPGGDITLRCHVTGNAPFYFYWSREDGRPIPASAKPLGEGENLHFSRVQPTDSGVYICTCRSPESVNTSKAEIVVSAAPSKPITVTVEEQRVQTVRPGSDVTFICTAKSKSPAYTLVWTRQHNRKLPDRAMDFNGILTIRRVQPEDAGIYVCTGSNMYDMDEGNATLYVQESSQTQMFYGPYETFEGHRPSGTTTSPNAAAEPRQLTVQRGQSAEFHCTATGNPTPTVEWTGGPNGGLSSRAIVQGGILRFQSVEPSDEGQYTCRVQNSVGQHFARVNLRVHSGSLPEVQVSPERTEVREGDTVRLYCRAGGTPTATISWKKEGGDLPSQARTERTDISTLVIPSISAADGGTYLCVGTSSAGSSQARIEVIVIRVPVHGPALRIEPSSDTIIEGQSVELNCASPNPYVTVTWHRGGGQPLSPNHQAYGSRLRILQASAADSGEYICRVTNGGSTQQASIVITITRSSGTLQPSGNVPALRIEPSSDRLVEGQTLELNCLFPNYPNAVVTWDRAGYTLSPNHQVSGSRLRILKASVADSGEYICRVTTGSLTQEASILVTITRASGPALPSGNGPAVRIESSSGPAVEGQTLDLNCMVAGQPNAVVTWERTGRPLSPNHQVLGSRLRIHQASVADSGEYICRTTTAGTTRQASIMVTITRRTSSSHSSLITPTINIESTSDSIAEGRTVVLNCVIEGRPHEEVTWYRPDQPLAPNHQVSGSRLQIIHASPKDSGEYICRIHSGSGVQMASIMVSIEGSSLNTGLQAPIRIESSSEAAELGQTIDLNCLADGRPGAVVTWHRLGGLPLASNHQVSGSRMRILQASPTDSGIYICRVSTSSGSQEASITINVQSSVQVPNQFPHPILIEKSADAVSEGQTLELNCIVVGQPQAPVSWHRTGAPFSSNHQISGSHLRIVQASTADSGQYVCRHDTGTGVQQASMSVSILSGAASSYRLQSPVISIDPHSATVQRGQNATFKCRIHDGAKPIRVTWQMRHNQPMEDNVHISPNGSIITIVGAHHKNQGSYRCMASNAYGMVHSSVNLVVEGRPSVSVIPQGKIRVKVGEPINVECMGIGDPRPIVSWRRTGARENLKQYKLGSLDGTAVLQIPSAKSADSGSYTCVALNPFGSTQVQVEVLVEGHVESPEAPLLVLADKPLHVVVAGGQASLNCTASGNPTPTITWSKLRAPLPWQHQVINNTLIIPNVAQQDSGQYICNASNANGFAEIYVTLDVEIPTYATTFPHETSVSTGESIKIQCLSHGTHPLKFQWSKVDGTLPDQASSRDGVLHIDRASASDSGTYRCVASNKVGSSEAFAQVTVSGKGVETGRPTASIIPRGPIRVKVGHPIYLECMGKGDPRPVVSWRRTGTRQNLKPQQLVPLDSNAVLQILSARPEDSGSYTCTAQNPSGSTQVHVEVHVEGHVINPGAPKVTADQPLLVVVTGGRATLSCRAVGNPAPKITWSKLRAPLPWQHEVVNDTLIIPKAALQDSGQYICNASNAEGYSEVFITLDVETPPYATTLPDEVSVSVGEVVQIQCLAHGTSPLKFQWSKVNGSLPDRATVRDSTLHINLAKATDAGTYRCVVSNKVGSSEAFAQVSILAPFAVRVSPLIDTKPISGTAEFTCTAIGDPQARIQWFKDGGQLPAGHQVQGGVLRIPNLEFGHEGTYTCRISSRFGQAQESVKLVLQALPKVRINIRTSVQTVLAGNSVEFECLALGDPRAKVTWSKVGSRLPSDAVISGGTLRIEQVKQSDAGQYRCTVANDVGEVQSHVILHVQSVPQIAAQPEMKEITAGSTAVFPCLASGFPVPDITWSKLEGELPIDHQMENNVLTIPSVKPEDAGTYVCTAANRQGRVTAFSMLKVRERVVPYFTGQPQSYLTLPSIKDAHKKLEIKITFRPDTADGMLVYSGQKKSNGADFVSFGLVGGRPEFRFDAGSGMATIRYPTPISLGEFHTVTLYRNLTQGSLVVDKHVPVNGTSQGKFQGLDLNEELFLGGYPNYDFISKTGLSSGFVGCIRQLVIQEEEVIFKDLDLSASGVSNCPTCRDRPCKNRGTCHDSESSSYVCVCPTGFTGSNCEHSQALHCHPEACGPDATCINRADGQGYTCRCHLGKSGDKCMDGVMVNTPTFNGDTSYISYPPLTNIHNELRVDLEFKPISSDGLLFFSGGKAAPVEDFVSIAMVGGYLEFRYELGSGLAILRSLEPLTLGQWHKATAERVNKDGTLIVDSSDPVKRSSPGKSQGLNLKTLMYLGGIDGSVELPSAINISRHFQGCIGEVSINGKKVDISYSFIESLAIGQCYDNSPCDRMPCLHGGRCLPTGEYEYQCLCLDGFKGDRCEMHEDHCQIHNPCLNGGICKDNRCHCLSGFSGTICEHGRTAETVDREWPVEGSGGNDAPGLYGSYFSDDSYIALPKHVFPRSRPDAPETIELEVRTTSSDGVILWQGMVSHSSENHLLGTNQEENEQGKGKDFISMGLKDGHLLFSYQLGSGEANIRSEDPVNDGEWHRIVAVREGKLGSIQIDGEDSVSGASPGRNIMVNTKGSVYLGGAPNVKTLTGGKFSSGISGCIKNLVILNARPSQQFQQPIDLKHHAEAGHNTKECPS